MIQTWLVAGVVFLGVFTQSLTGFGVALVAMAVLPDLIGIRVASPLVALVSLTIGLSKGGLGAVLVLAVTPLLRSQRVTPGEPTVTRALGYLEQFLGPKGGIEGVPLAEFHPGLSPLFLSQEQRLRARVRRPPCDWDRPIARRSPSVLR